jgi:hypothetical protein
LRISRIVPYILSRLERPWIELEQQIALLHQLAILDRHMNERTGYARDDVNNLNNLHPPAVRRTAHETQTVIQTDDADFTSPRQAARAFTPKLSALSESPLYDTV